MGLAAVLLSGGLLMGITDASAAMEKATVAGGCFWCIQGPFDHTPGVLRTRVGYTGGKTANPTYEQVSSGNTGHIEALEIEFDPAKVTYDQILDIFWRQIDPTDPNGQFADQGSQYVTAIFYHSDTQKKVAEASKAKLGSSGQFKKPIATRVIPAVVFYPAEDYHQTYYEKNPTHYNAYKKGSGRAGYIEKTWGEKK